MRALLALFAIGTLIAVFRSSEAAFGVDVSQAVSQSAWSCLKNHNVRFAIVRIYRSGGKPDSNSAATIKNARAAGIRYVDGYIFPCKKCGNPKAQVQAAVNNLRGNGAQVGQIWIDVEVPQKWSERASDNVNFIRGLVQAAQTQGYTVGIYTSAREWTPIAGGSTAFRDLQLWYAHFDNQSSFSDFRAFGGWTTPVMKQYADNARLCGVLVDKNWYP